MKILEGPFQPLICGGFRERRLASPTRPASSRALDHSTPSGGAVDTVLLQALLDQDIVPRHSALGMRRRRSTYRLNSDAVAVEVARALRAVKPST